MATKIRSFFYRLKRASKKPIGYILERLFFELQKELDIHLIPIKLKLLTKSKFLKKNSSKNIDLLWNRLANKPYIIPSNLDSHDMHRFSHIHLNTLLNDSENIMDNKIDLLGTGMIYLGKKINWNKDYKSGIVWQPKKINKINYVNPNDDSDVKIPWEISRLQWLIPICQLYQITKNEIYAKKVKDVLTDWIYSNPYANTVNWACTMDVALRIYNFTYFFHVFNKSIHWAEESFRYLFLKSIWLHGRFTLKYIEKSDINGNHYTADASGLVISGLFFDVKNESKKWYEIGWDILKTEIKTQVYDDGIDFESSIPYHRLVTELFLYPYLMILKNDKAQDLVYEERLSLMCDFILHYMRPNGTSPVLGDNDNARTLPMSMNNLLDHHYLIEIFKANVKNEEIESNLKFHPELFWFIFPNKFSIPSQNLYPNSKAFEKGGIYIMRNKFLDHILIDCGPVGLAGRGGHGHNDILSFEAFLDGEMVINDVGSPSYTGDFHERNLFRSTMSHNTPMVNNQEINRFLSKDDLWNLHNDASKPELILWESNKYYDIFIGTHNGYERDPINCKPIRLICLNKNNSSLVIKDKIIGDYSSLSIPFHLNENLNIEHHKDEFLLTGRNNKYLFKIEESEKWHNSVESCNISYSYGQKIKSNKIQFFTQDILTSLTIFICPLNKYEKESYNQQILLVNSLLDNVR